MKGYLRVVGVGAMATHPQETPKDCDVRPIEVLVELRYVSQKRGWPPIRFH